MDYNFTINPTEENVFDIKVIIKENKRILYRLQYQAIYNGVVLLDLPKLQKQILNQQIRMEVIRKTKDLIRSHFE